MGEAIDTDDMREQSDSLLPLDPLEEVDVMKEKTTSLPLLDQHISLIKEHSSWWLPTAGGIFAIGLRFYDPLLEYVDLNSGLFQNVLESMSGEIILFNNFGHNLYILPIIYKNELIQHIIIDIFSVTTNAILWPFLDVLRPITDYVFGPSTTIRPFLELTPILHPFINLGQCFGSGADLPFTVTLNIKQTIISFFETYETVGTGRSFAESIGRC